MRKALVLGVNGYLGSNFAHMLQTSGYHVTGSDVQASVILPGIDYISCDVTSMDALKSLDWQTDAVFCFFGATGTQAGFQYYRRFIEINEIGLLNVLESIRLAGTHPVVLFPSTRLMYAASDGSPLEEVAALDPKTIYAVNKIAGEHFLKVFKNRYGIPYVIFRIGVPYGNLAPGAYSFGTMAHFLTQARNGQPIRVFGDGRQRRSFTHISDIYLQVMAVAAQQQHWNEVYNICGEELDLATIAQALAVRFGVPVHFEPWTEEDLLLEVGDSAFSGKRIRQATGVCMQYQFKDWVAAL